MLVNCSAYNKGKLVSRIELEDINKHLKKDGYMVWVAIKDPTYDELTNLQNQFKLPELAVEDAQHGHQRPKIEEYGESVFAVIHLPEIQSTKLVVGEMSVFLGKNYVLSIRTNSHKTFQTIRDRLETDQSLLNLGPGIIFYALLDSIVDKYFPLLYSFENELDAIEQYIFNKRASHKTVKNLYALKSKVMQLKHIVLPLLESVKRLVNDKRLPQIFDNTHNYFRDVSDHLSRISTTIDSIIDRINTAMHANISLLAIEDSEVTKRLASWAAIFAVATALLGIWGMNFSFMPELQWKYGYFVALGIIVCVCLYLYYRFKKSGWL